MSDSADELERPRGVSSSPSGESRFDREALARVLGIASIGSGLALLMAPRPTAAFYGLPARLPWLVRALGARDVVVGAGLLESSARDPGPWLHARAASELVDGMLIASLGQGPLRSAKAVASLVLAIAFAYAGREPT